MPYAFTGRGDPVKSPRCTADNMRMTDTHSEPEGRSDSGAAKAACSKPVSDPEEARLLPEGPFCMILDLLHCSAVQPNRLALGAWR